MLLSLILEAIEELVARVRRFFRDLRRYDRVDTGLGKGYHDPRAVLLHACFACLDRYVNETGGLYLLEASTAQLRADTSEGQLVLKAQADTQEAFAELYRYWHDIRPELKVVIDELTNRVDGDASIDRAIELEDELDRKDQEALEKLIKHYRHLWT